MLAGSVIFNQVSFDSSFYPLITGFGELFSEIPYIHGKIDEDNKRKMMLKNTHECDIVITK